MKMEEAVKRILALGQPESQPQPQSRAAGASLSDRAIEFLGRMYGPGAAAMGAAFDPARLARPDNPVAAAGDFGNAYLEM
jgi:hypothetical protein